MLEPTCPKSKLSPLRASFALVSFLIMLSANVHASQTYAQSPIDGGDAIFANSASGAILADNFTLANQSQLEAITWWGSYDTNDVDDFIIRLYGDASGAPGTEIQSYSGITVTTSSTALTDISTAPVYRYDFTLPLALTLNSGAYYLAITNETTHSGWYWSVGTNVDSQHWELTANGIDWNVNTTGDQAFLVQYTETTPVPLPSAIWLMGTGLFVPLRKGFLKGAVTPKG